MKNNDEELYLRGRIRDLWRGASEQGYLTHSRFLSLSEQAVALDELRREGAFQVISAASLSPFIPETAPSLYVPGSSASPEASISRPASEKIWSGSGSPFCLLSGGHPDADRRIMVFCPSWMDLPEIERHTDPLAEAQDSFSAGTVSRAKANDDDPLGDLISCLHITPRSARFTDHPGHRDYLGALMHLGFSREEIGDIMTGNDEAWIFVLKEMADVICRELTSVRRTSVTVSPLHPGSPVPVQKTVMRSGSIASERIDCIVAFVFKLSRSRAQELVASEAVFCGGRLPSGPSYNPSAGERISVRGYGKFIYRGVTGKTKKGRCTAIAEVFE